MEKDVDLPNTKFTREIISNRPPELILDPYNFFLKQQKDSLKT
jgi:hypothetical protein